MLTNKDYCDYDTCVALKEVGCDQHYDKYKETNSKGEYIFDWFTLYEAQKWLREEKKIEVLVLSKGMIGAPYDVQVYTEDYIISDDREYSSYEEALSEGLRTSIKILQDEQKENN